MAEPVNLLLWAGIAGIVWMLLRCWETVHEEESRPAWRGYLVWVAKGLVGPIALWIVLGAGLWPGSTPLIPELARLKGKAGFGDALIAASGPVAFLAASLWVAISAGWLTVLACPRVRDPRDYRATVLFWTAVLVLPAWGLWKVGGPYAAGAALSVWLLPVCWFTTNLQVKQVTPPSYSKAIAQAKFGRFAQAEKAVLDELEQHQDDVEGWMMLAELYATRFHDLAEADRTVRQLCQQPGIEAVRISLALNRLADWHLKYNQDPVAARAALAELIRLLPETHAARMAGQRLAQMARTREEWIEQQNPKPISLPALSDTLEDGAHSAVDTLSPTAARDRADRCVERLREDPNRADARDEFARLLAGPLGKHALAIEQWELLVGLSEPSDHQRAEWLAQMAICQEQKMGDPAAARRTLERLVREYPQTSQAFAAQRRLSRLEVEQRLQARQRHPAPPPHLKVKP